MQISECFNLVSSYLVYVLPLAFVINSVALLVNMFMSAVFKGKLKVTL